MRSVLLATAVLMIIASGCTSQAASPESATAAPHLENTPRPTHAPAPTTPATLPATAPPALENTPQPIHIANPTPPSTFQPGQREYMYRTVKDLASEGLLSVVGEPAATDAEYRATCTLLRKHNWDFVDSARDPDSTLRTGGLGGAFIAIIGHLRDFQEERGVAVYTVLHFCEDVTGIPHSYIPSFSPVPGNASGPTRILDLTTPAIYPTFQPGQREYMYKDVKDMVSDAALKHGQLAPTEAEYRASCRLLRKHEWDVVEIFTELDATDQTIGLALVLVGEFKEWTQIQEERGLAVYSLAHFCEDVLEE